MENHMPIWEKINLTIKEASIYSNIGINKIQEISKAPRCHFVLYVGIWKIFIRGNRDIVIVINCLYLLLSLFMIWLTKYWGSFKKEL